MKRAWLVVLVMLFVVGLPGSTFAQTTSLISTFPYQGYLTNASGSVSGTCDFQFGLFNAATAGAQIGSTLTQTGVTVTNGTFNVQLDFGGTALDGTDRYLEIAVRCPTGSGGYTTLAPRQAVTPALYAVSLYGLRVQQNATSPNLIGGFNGNTMQTGTLGGFIGGGGENGDVNSVTDNYGVVSGGEDNQAGDGISNSGSAQFATVGGGSGNTARASLSTIGGGENNVASGISSTIGGGAENTVTATSSVIAGGQSNSIQSHNATIGGGANNAITGINNDYATIGGGVNNIASGDSATVGGGLSNTASDQYATVAGGDSNTANATAATVSGGNFNGARNVYATVGGGNQNTASGLEATVGGGFSNVASGDQATVGGGQANTASGPFATILGGLSNTAAGQYSFAAGRRADAAQDGTFVWADSTDADFSTNQPNQFFVRASGGIAFYTSANLSSGAQLSAGSGSWSNLSDRNSKSNFVAIDPQAILQNVVNMPISTWNYNAENPAIRHIGPMAQDFYASFGVGEDNTHISTIDSEGVALAAIQGLYQQVQAKDTVISDLQTRLDRVETQLSALQGGQPLEANGLPGWVVIGMALIGMLQVSVIVLFFVRRSKA